MGTGRDGKIGSHFDVYPLLQTYAGDRFKIYREVTMVIFQTKTELWVTIRTEHEAVERAHKAPSPGAGCDEDRDTLLTVRGGP